MGFYVTCPGADLLKQMSENADGLLGEPYALYIIALATYIDDEALQWISDYATAFDSLTGPFGVFLLFYNEASVATGWIPSNNLGNVTISGKTLRGGSSAVDRALKFEIKVRPERDVLL